MHKKQNLLKIITVKEQRPALPINKRRIYVLTGDVNSGKSTVLRSWINQWNLDKVAICGIFTEALIKNGHKIGYDLIDVKTKKNYPLIRSSKFRNNWSVGRYHFDRDGFTQLEESVINTSVGELLILDELGPLELEHNKGLFELFRFFLLKSSIHLLLVVRDSQLRKLLNTINSLLNNQSKQGDL